MSRREKGKEDRKRRIVDAAKRLLEGTGGTGFNMRELAIESGVSPATPFNLFGSKNAVLISVFDEDLAEFLNEFEEVQSSSTISRFFDFVRLAQEVIGRREGFYRVIHSSISIDAPPDLRTGLMSPRAQIYETLAIDAINHQDINDTVAPQAFATSVAYIMGGVLQRWIAGEIGIEDFESNAGYGIALLLSGIVSDGHSEFVQKRIYRYQDEIQASDAREGRGQQGPLLRAANS